MDCDSFVLSIERNDFRKDLIKLKEDKDLFDFNKTAGDYLFFCIKNTDIIGKLKIETPDKLYIKTFCALRSKAYAFLKPIEKQKN